ncbi:MAG: AAA family ATPase [Vicingaceae bacterium]
MSSQFKETFFSHLPGEASSDQLDLIDRMERFLFQPIDRPAFIIRGYAGTGKTTAVGALVKTLPRFRYKSVLLAPTGRAAKVLSKFSQKPAFTIHKKIYQSKKGADGQVRFELAANLHTNTVFMVDEASMIADKGGILSSSDWQSRSLLEDLMEYVYSGKNCRLVLIGDIAQLPPVGSELSPALDPKYLQSNFNLKLKGVELKEVLRQAKQSGILQNATTLRQQIASEEPKILFDTAGFEDVKRINGMELEDELHQAVADFGEEEVMIVTRSNKRANEFNQQVRIRIRGQEEEISTGDFIMVVKNNYFWLGEKAPAGFIANGDIAEVMGLGNEEHLHGFRFIEASLRLLDYPKQPTIEAKLLLDVIQSESPALEKEKSMQLYQSVKADYFDLSTKKKQNEAIRKDPYLNALQIKFAYAVTCHKSQGGQWKAVFVDQGYLTEEMVDKEYLRWLYTAITRATERLYLVNFHPQFFGEEAFLKV